eukprot:gnl/Spiro4/4976_TR2481_c0_g1_i1.p1 gnl/Spiro4/4976_TR2481_c0_g1~~gnl/Spiro4/4976_TR2481_c0_g1_i1.p1  ORF type:complete len:443 (-),score=88.50 gnl/Spiro4/4976_TR2481_c0_g1_i1:101-1330(-)
MFRREKRNEQVNNTRFYTLLGVEKTATADEISRAHKRMAMKYHPDRCKEPGANERYAEIQAAYDILKDPQKRALYDRVGEEGLKEGAGGGGGGGGFPFGFPFGFGGHDEEDAGPPRGRDVKHVLAVTLEDLYNGKTKRLNMTKNVICATCAGLGGKNVRSCTACNGRGFKVVIQMMGPMQMQQRMECDECHGEKQTASEKCVTCKGNKVVRQTKTHEIVVEQGMKHGQPIVLREEADQYPGITPGDIVILLDQQKHEKFTREGDNLHYNLNITLVEALCGFKTVIEHLDQRKLLIEHSGEDCISPDEVRAVRGEGMPTPRNPFEKGMLLIKFTITFPKALPVPVRQGLETLIPFRNPIPTYSADEVYDVVLTPIDEETVRASQRQHGRGQATDDDDSETQPQGVQCQQA